MDEWLWLFGARKQDLFSAQKCGLCHILRVLKMRGLESAVQAMDFNPGSGAFPHFYDVHFIQKEEN